MQKPAERTETYKLNKEEVITIINAFYVCHKRYGANKRQYAVAKKLLGKYSEIDGQND